MPAVGVNAPPADAQDGDCWIVGTAPLGEWTGHAGEIAGWTTGGWRFVPPVEGMAAWSLSAGAVVRRIHGAWTAETLTGAALVVGGQQVVGRRQPAVPTPQGGSTIDVEARNTLAAVMGALRAHGLIEA